MSSKPEQCSLLASRIVERISEPYDIDGRHIVIGTSIGIAIAPGDGTNPDVLLKNADMALYLAKGEGRGTHRFFEGEMDKRLQARHALELDLRKAITVRRVRALLPADHRAAERQGDLFRGAAAPESPRARS